MNNKVMIILRGVPSSGKSYRAEQLKGDDGVIFSTDEYWYKVNFPDRPDEYSFNVNLLHVAHKWNVLRAQRAVDMGHPRIIIDNTNTTADLFCCNYLRYAHFQGYELQIEEPTSEWWLEIRELLKRKRDNNKKIKEWAKILFEKNKQSHNAPLWVMERMMWKWECDLDPNEVLDNCLDNHADQL